MPETKYLIIGAGPASGWAVRGIRHQDKDGAITIVGREPYRTYSLPLLTKGFIQGRYPEEKVFIVKEDFYEKQGVQFISGTPAVSLNTGDKTVTLDDGRQLSYEKLLICTGASPLIFPVPGGDLRRVYYLRTLDDAKLIKAAAGSAESAVVVGGSFIGVELACALREIGLSVELLMLEDYIWQTLIPEAVGQYLMDIMREHGVSIHPGQKVTEFKGSGGLAESLVIGNGSVFEADMFGVGIGARLNIDFLKDSDIAISKGLLVNSYLETNVPDVYAAGDVAEFDDPVLGIRHLTGHIENAQFQGRIAGQNMAGGSAPYAQVTGYDTEVFGNMLMFVGAPDLGDEHIIRGSAEAPSGSFSIKAGRIVGALLMNPGGKDIRAVREFVQIKDVDFKRHENELSDPGADLPGLLNKIKGSEDAS